MMIYVVKFFDLFLCLICFFALFLQSIKAVYDRIIDLRIATPQVIINYGVFLEEKNYFEEAFKVYFQLSFYGSIFKIHQILSDFLFLFFQAYEKGISLFKWPNVYDIWNTYLVKFLKRYVSIKIM